MNGKDLPAKSDLKRTGTALPRGLRRLGLDRSAVTDDGRQDYDMKQVILLADDSLTIGKVVDLTFLDEPNFRVVHVTDGNQACQAIERQAPALVIADVHMPEKNGYEVCAFAKSFQPGIPVILLIGTFEPFDEAKSRAAGADCIIKKPFDTQDLFETVQRLLSRRGIEGASSLGSSLPVDQGRASSSQPSQQKMTSSGDIVRRRIFISYRRRDSSDITGRLYDRLVANYGRQGVFKDVDSIPLGANFRAHIDRAIAESRAVVAVIGRWWLNSDESDPTRDALRNPRDFVRLELESALRQKVPIIPVFVGGASMPHEDQLPSSLTDLCYINGMSLRADPDFHNDVNRLIAGLNALMR